MLNNPRTFLLSLYASAIEACQPAPVLPAYLRKFNPDQKPTIIGAGKASAEMARIVEQYFNAPLDGLVISHQDTAGSCQHIRIVKASHPEPDRAGTKASQEILNMVSSLSHDDLVICLLSGGGSALMNLPVAGFSLEEKQALTRALLHSGAPIEEINVVRKHLSRIKGGKLARACAPARMVNLVLSDVVGDDLSTIASGPLSPDPSRLEDARNILKNYNIPCPDALFDPANETLKPGDGAFDTLENHIIARGRDALACAQEKAEKHGITVINLGDQIIGEARDVAHAHKDLILQHLKQKSDNQPCLILSGGELTVTLKNPAHGRGGPNTEYMLALMHHLQGPPQNIYALSCDTDGKDGSGNNAGALITPDSFKKARDLGLDPQSFLTCNDSYGFFEKIGDLIITGPSRTNVNDFRAILLP